MKVVGDQGEVKAGGFGVLRETDELARAVLLTERA